VFWEQQYRKVLEYLYGNVSDLEVGRDGEAAATKNPDLQQISFLHYSIAMMGKGMNKISEALLNFG